MSTKLHLAGADYGIFILGRTILNKNPVVHLTFFYKVGFNNSENVLSESHYWPEFDKNTRPDGVMFDHHHADIFSWAQNLKIPTFPTQALHHLANEGLSDSVEFRRLARKFIRRAKEHNCRTLFFPEAIFAETRTHQILQHLAGSQMKIQTIDAKITATQADKRKITIYHDLKDITFLKSRAEDLLGTKLKRSDFESVSDYKK